MTQETISIADKATKIPSFIILTLLLFVIFATTAESFHSQLLKFGAKTWPNYTILRTDIPTPSCNPNVDIAARMKVLEAESGNIDEDDLFATTFDREATQKSLVAQNELCQSKHDVASTNQAQVTTGVRVYRAVETTVAKFVFFSLSMQRVILILFIFVGGSITTLRLHHISFRAIQSKLDHRVSLIGQLICHIFLAISTVTYLKNVDASNVPIANKEIIYLLIIGFCLLGVINIYQIMTMPNTLKNEGSITHAILSIPVYVFMMIGSGTYFMVSEGNLAASSVYFNMAFEFASIFVSIALYIWVGMLLKETRLGELVFNIFKPWKLPPEMLAFVAILIMAIPTAYTGGSGIIVLALGIVVYEELRRVGTRRQLALATTAMTGSSGVVLKPCLLIVLIAALNKDVVTDELYGWGIKIFILTLASFLFYAFLTKKESLKMASPNEAWGPIKVAFMQLIPYVTVITLVVLAYALFLEAYVDEFTAYIILPTILMAVILYERTRGLKNYSFENDDRSATTKTTISNSVDNAVVHIGALLIVVCCGLAVGGAIQRSGIFDNIPQTFANVWIAMGFIVGLLVIIGMTMDAMAAIFMISGSLAPIAYRNGIDPLHFWMTVLVALELGYLSPPVALNHLLVRQVVGEKEAALAALEGDTFWYKHERLLLPLVIMGTAVLIVAFGPLIVGYNE